MKKFNWMIWAGFLLSVIAFLSYPTFFVRFAATRDFPWANLLLFVVAGVLTLIGIRRAFAADRPHPKRSKAAGATLALLSVLVLSFFVFSVFIMSRWLPASTGAPRVGQKAPDFTLTDQSGKPVSLGDLLTSPVDGKIPRGVLLIFYRGYW
ncbi:MAG TPA: hypothetical protein VGW76_10630 [Pyrinomonadaceae bacterium]|nr:hypothetical protein [Pyrinomonadaceae bacterium]